MALKVTLSEFSREKLVETMATPWFNELLETLRNVAGSVEQSYTGSRTLSEMEHQALNGSFRRGAMTIIEAVVLLGKKPVEKAEPPKAPWNELAKPTPDPKALTSFPTNK